MNWNVVLGVSFLLFWGGYYPALVLAWRTGVARGPLLLAGVVGACGCFGMPILTWLLVSTQRKQLDQLMGSADIDVEKAQREGTMLKAFVGVAALGFVGQIVAGNFAPDVRTSEDGSVYDSGYDDSGYDNSGYDEPAYDNSGYDEPALGEPAYPEPSAPTTPIIEPEIDEPPSHDPRVFSLPPPDSSETLTWEGWTLTMSRDRRQLLVLDGRSPRALVVVSRSPLPRRALGDFVRVDGTAEGGVVQPAHVNADGRNVLDAIPRARRFTLGEASSPGDPPTFVVLQNVVAIDGETIAAEGTTEPTLHVVAPRGTLRRGQSYPRFYGAYFPAADTRPSELWWIEGADALP